MGRHSFSEVEEYLRSADLCHTPRYDISHRALAAGQYLVHKLKSPCVEQMVWRVRVSAALACATDTHIEPQKSSPVNHRIAYAPIILSLSEHSTAPRSLQMIECDRGSSLYVRRMIILPSLWWDVWLGESSPGFLFMDCNAIATNQITQNLRVSSQTSTSSAKLPDAPAATEEVHLALAGEYLSPLYKQSSPLSKRSRF